MLVLDYMQSLDVIQFTVLMVLVDAKYIKAMVNLGDNYKFRFQKFLIFEEYVCKLYSTKNNNQIKSIKLSVLIFKLSLSLFSI